MYAEFFGLRELPFNNTPDPRFFYSTPNHEEALASLIYAVKERKGFVLLTGEVGAGKTLVTRMMLRQFGANLAFANITHAVPSARDLMESVCTEFELPYDPAAGNAQLVRTLHDFLLAKFAQNLPVVLILDEAQNLPVEAFEQLRMIGNLEADDAKLLQIAIVGQPELQQLFLSPQLRQLRQRIFRSFHLPAMDRGATEGYIRYRLSVAAARDLELFSPRAVDRIYRLSGGLPRIINTLCDNAMLSAYSSGQRKIDEALIDSVVAQMNPLPEDTLAPRGDVPSPPPGRTRTALRPMVPAATSGFTRHAESLDGVAYSVPIPPKRAMVVLPPRPVERALSTPRAASPPVLRRAAGEKAPAQERAATTDALAVHASLTRLTERARQIITRAESAARDLQRREEKMRALSQDVKTVADQLGRLMGGSRTAHRPTPSRSRDTTPVEPQPPIRPSQPRLVKAVVAPVSTTTPNRVAEPISDFDALQQLLRQTREGPVGIRPFAVSG